MSEDQDPYRSEREFLKLLIGLDTGAIGALFYAQERLVPKHYDSIVALYGSGLLLFLVSLGSSLLASRILIDLEHVHFHDLLEVPGGDKVWERTDFWKIMRRFSRFLYFALASFFSGVLNTVVLMLWSLKHFSKLP